MAIEQILNTRIQLKYDSFANWSKHNPVLKAGEVAIAYLTTTDAVAPGQGDSQHPILFKVGPGNFNDLPWASALAADVHSWAKKNEAEFKTWVKGLIEVTDIDAYSKAQIDSKLTDNSAADQKYAKDYADSLAKNYDAAGTAQDLIDGLDVADSAVTGKYVSAVSETDGKISVTRADLPTYTLATGSANGTVAFNGADVAVKGLGTAAYTNAAEYDKAGAADAVNTALENYKTTNNEAVANAAAKGQKGIEDAAEALRVANLKIDKIEAASTYATKSEAQGYADAKDSAIAAAKKAGDDAQSNLNNYISANDAEVAKKATITALEAEIARAKAAEKANADAIELLTNGVDAEKIDGVTDLINYVTTHGPEVLGMKGDIENNAQDIADEVSRATAEESRLAGLIQSNAGAIDTNTKAIAALKSENGKVAAATKADVASGLDEAGIAQVIGVKVNNATNADNASNADKLGGVAASSYALKTEVENAASGVITTANNYTLDQLKNYYTKTDAEAKFMDSEETSTAIDNKISALNLGTTYEPIGAETRAKAYADGLAGNYATATQGGKADTALQNIEAGTGLKVSTKSGNKQTISFDDSVVFVFNCGNASTLVD